MNIKKVALLGYGEVWHILGQELQGLELRVFDIKRQHPSCTTVADAVRDADLIICAVTAAQTVAAAQSVTTAMKAGAWYMDLNSASPEAKAQAAAAVTAATGRYVEVAVMSPIEPKRLASPMLLGGAHAQGFEPLIRQLGFTGADFYSETPGKVSATKLCRSIVIKGLEALISESLLSARFYGVEDTVLSSLNNLFPHPDWEGYARYMIARTLEHGQRRSEEMCEAARTVAQAGITPWMSEATAKRQAWSPAFVSALESEGLNPMLDTMRDLLQQSENLPGKETQK